MIKIVCSTCQKPITLDEAKFPSDAVTFPCSNCKTKLTVNRRDFRGPEAVAAAPIETAAPPATPSQPDEVQHDADGFGSRALIVGADHPALRQAATLIGFMPVHFATAAEAREFYMQEFPQFVIISPSPLTAPPLEAMQAIISLMPADRRKSFFVLIADGLRTLDGNAAFLYGVNLVVAARDVASFPRIYRDAHAYHERLYAPMSSVLKAMHTE